jgi:hypothetical protein
MEKYKELKEKIRSQRSKAKMCLNKRKFKTKEAAYLKGQRVYKCKFCGKWHRSGQQARIISEIKNIGRPIKSGLKILSRPIGGYWDFVIIKPNQKKKSKPAKKSAESKQE